MCFEPLAGLGHVTVTERERKVDFARVLNAVSAVHYANAYRIVLVCDNRFTHSPAALYEAFEPTGARRLAERFQWHHTLVHGSWLYIMEIELSVLARQCLDRQIPDAATLERELATWERERNTVTVGVRWHFAAADARTKLDKLIPIIRLR